MFCVYPPAASFCTVYCFSLTYSARSSYSPTHSTNVHLTCSFMRHGCTEKEDWRRKEARRRETEKEFRKRARAVMDDRRGPISNLVHSNKDVR